MMNLHKLFFSSLPQNYFSLFTKMEEAKPQLIIPCSAISLVFLPYAFFIFCQAIAFLFLVKPFYFTDDYYCN